jgi:hypothetical protein
VTFYRKQAEREWGKYDPGSLTREPRFFPGTKRKSIPYFEYKHGIRFEAGRIDQEGIHRYAVPKGPIL